MKCVNCGGEAAYRAVIADPQGAELDAGEVCTENLSNWLAWFTGNTETTGLIHSLTITRLP
jgi:hypothetical protein